MAATGPPARSEVVLSGERKMVCTPSNRLIHSKMSDSSLRVVMVVVVVARELDMSNRQQDYIP
jgi:hypothetical protein